MNANPIIASISSCDWKVEDPSFVTRDDALNLDLIISDEGEEKTSTSIQLSGTGSCILKINFVKPISLMITSSCRNIECYTTAQYIGTFRGAADGGEGDRFTATIPQLSETTFNVKVESLSTVSSSSEQKPSPSRKKDNATTEITSTKFNPMDILLKQAIDSGSLDPMVLNGLLDNVHLSNFAMKAKEEAKRDTTDNRGTIPTPLSSLTSQIEAKRFQFDPGTGSAILRSLLKCPGPTSLAETMNGEPELLKCRDTNLQVLNILTQISSAKKEEDVTEFVTNIQLVQITINGLLKSKKEFSAERLFGLQSALNQYHHELNELENRNTLLRFFGSTRLRRKLEQMNSSVHTQLEQLKKSIKADEKAAKLAESKSTSGTESSTSISNSASSFDIASPSMGHNEFLRLSQRLHRWTRKKAFFDLREDEIKVLLYILDNSNTGNVNQHKFSEFLKGFGPVNDCIRNMKSIMSCPWFYGFISRQETDLFLRDQPNGTFLIRFSSTQPGAFALGFIMEGREVHHILIKADKPSGFVVTDQSSVGRHFPNLLELVDYYRLFLVHSFWNELPFEPFFEGDISSAETIESFHGHLEGTFLVRFSSHPGKLAISYVEDQSVLHTLIVVEPGRGYRLDTMDVCFPTVKDVVQACGDTLRTPLKNSTAGGGSSNSMEALKTLVQWKHERATGITTVYHQTVGQLFDLNVNPPYDVNAQTTRNEEIDARVDELIARLFDLR
ncbi:FYN/Yes-like tyrosine-protein kinase [Planoprotostelium fungivorum]|uniref:FYN/Yes-like tyrosine-protein kinase n=1 Tax=Planoprotostelium fungivorum TaxID=1890364 RepID=A0A2P6N1H3_9EUKA|nr:FYN/Yes-like tyrosine-protein kinase [Planoprotostelium fungivorum]